MFVSNYISSLSILNVMNQHSSAMAKHMSHIATGSRIASVAEDPSGWAIGMRMSVQVRGLDQANSNAQKYKSMLKVADGGISSTVDILRTLKEKAIEAANDTSTESDRQTIQKLFNQYADQIDDNSLITYNGKYLINGSHNTASKLTNQAYTNSSLSTDTTTDTKLTDLLRRNGDSLNILADDTVNVSYVKDGKTYTTSYKVEDTTVKDIFTKANAIDTAVFDVDNMSDTSEIGVDETGKTVKTVDDKNALTIKAKTAGTDGAVSGFTISITDKHGQVKKNANSSLDAFTEKIQPRNENSGDMLYAQTGTKSNQGIRLGIGDMTSQGLGLRSKDGDVLNVTTREGANAAISVLDNALNRALDQQTTIGAVSSRMDYTIQNLTTQSENTTAAMSTLMDANLAKEMVEYTKENILLQAAQAMLAQNNKNAAWFLSLLQ